MYYIFEDYHGDTHEVTFSEQVYSNGRLKLVMLKKGEHFLTVTQDVPEVELRTTQIAIDNYGIKTGILNFLIEEGIVDAPLFSVLIDERAFPIVVYRGYVAVDPEDLHEGVTVKLRGGYATGLLAWNDSRHTGVVEASNGTPISISIKDIVEIIRK